jgi:hypothetical protein
VLQTDVIPFPLGDSVGDFAVRKETNIPGVDHSVSTFFYYQPHGPSLEVAFAPNG